VNEDEEDEDLEFDENGEPVLEDDEEFMNEEFKADLAKLEVRYQMKLSECLIPALCSRQLVLPHTILDSKF
jgi:hypothetical protein